MNPLVAANRLAANRLEPLPSPPSPPNGGGSVKVGSAEAPRPKSKPMDAFTRPEEQNLESDTTEMKAVKAFQTQTTSQEALLEEVRSQQKHVDATLEGLAPISHNHVLTVNLDLLADQREKIGDLRGGGAGVAHVIEGEVYGSEAESASLADCMLQSIHKVVNLVQKVVPQHDDVGMETIISDETDKIFPIGLILVAVLATTGIGVFLFFKNKK